MGHWAHPAHPYDVHLGREVVDPLAEAAHQVTLEKH
jgi:hypothetical protein